MIAIDENVRMKEKHEEAFEALYAELADNLRKRLEWMFEKCESPIEALFLAGCFDSISFSPNTGEWQSEIDRARKALVRAAHLPARGENGRIVGIDAYVEQLPTSTDLLLVAQYVVPNLAYRIDFAVFVIDQKGEVVGKIAVEMDGHEFHERTKEQAKRDKSRDRKLVAAGWSVLRFTGSEIWANARKCATEVSLLAIDLLEPKEV